MYGTARLAVYVIVRGDSFQSAPWGADYAELRKKVLVILRGDTEYQPNTYTLPAGRVQQDESPLSAAMRELREETSLVVQQHQLRLAGIMHRRPDVEGGEYWIDLFFRAMQVSGEPVNTEPELHKSIELVELKEFLRPPERFMPHQQFFMSMYSSASPGVAIYTEFDPGI